MFNRSQPAERKIRRPLSRPARHAGAPAGTPCCRRSHRPCSVAGPFGATACQPSVPILRLCHHDQVAIQKMYRERWMREPEQTQKLKTAWDRAVLTNDSQSREGHRTSCADLYQRNVATAFKGSMHWRFGGLLWLNLLIACGDITEHVVHGLGVSGGVSCYGARTVARLVTCGGTGAHQRARFQISRPGPTLLRCRSKRSRRQAAASSDFEGPGRPCSAAGPNGAGARQQPDRASRKDELGCGRQMSKPKLLPQHPRCAW